MRRCGASSTLPALAQHRVERLGAAVGPNDFVIHTDASSFDFERACASRSSSGCRIKGLCGRRGQACRINLYAASRNALGGQLTVRDPKWKHDRVTLLPASVSAELNEQLVRAAALHQEDLAAGFGRVGLPEAIERKFPAASRDWAGNGSFPPRRDGGARPPRAGTMTTRRTCSAP
jgi:hypothetical protein